MGLEPRMFINHNTPAQVRKAAIASRVEALEAQELEELGLLSAIKRKLGLAPKKKKSVKSTTAVFDEKKHPRDKTGKFATTTTTKTAALQKMNKQVEVFWPNDIDEKSLGFKIEEKTPKNPGDMVDGISVEGKVYTMTLPTGKKISIYEADIQDSKPVGKDHQLSLLRALADMHMLYPKMQTNKIILKSEYKTPAVGSGKAAGWVNPNQIDRININIGSAAFRVKPDEYRSQSLIYHEAGHLYDYNRNKFGQIGNRALYNPGPAKALYNNKGLSKYTTDYGRTKPQESYAENFQEWHTSRGTTRNVAVVAYARSQKWYGYNNPVKRLLAPTTPSLKGPTIKPQRGNRAFAIDDSFLEDGGFIVADSFKPRASAIIGKVPELDPTKEEIAEVEEIISELLKDLGLT